MVRSSILFVASTCVALAPFVASRSSSAVEEGVEIEASIVVTAAVDFDGRPMGWAATLGEEEVDLLGRLLLAELEQEGFDPTVVARSPLRGERVLDYPSLRLEHWLRRFRMTGPALVSPAASRPSSRTTKKGD